MFSDKEVEVNDQKIKMLSWKEWNSFLKEFDFGSGNQPLRLGQAFLNKYYPDLIHADLFFCNGHLSCIEMIENLVDFEFNEDRKTTIENLRKDWKKNEKK